MVDFYNSASTSQYKSRPSAEAGSFTSCINAFAARLASKDIVPAELQADFFRFACCNTILPDSADDELTDSFIAVLVTLVSANYQSISGLQALSVLFSYLKADVRVFKRFYPTQELMLQLNLERYLDSGLEEEKRIALDFICFLLRFYDVDYSDIIVNPETMSKIRKAQFERTWTDIERLIANQEKIVKAARENQETNSKAFTELFVFIDEVKKNSEETMTSLHKEVEAIRAELRNRGRQVNSQGRYLAPDESVAELAYVKNIEAILGEKIEGVKILVDRVLKEASEQGYNYEEVARRVESNSVLVDDIAKKTEEIANVVKLDNKVLADTRGIMMARMSKAEEDIITLMSRSVALPKRAGEEAESMTSLRLDAIKAQIDRELMPRLSEMQLKLKTMEVQQSVISAQGMALNREGAGDASSALLAGLNEKGISGLSELVKAGMDSVSKEVKSYKVLLDAISRQAAEIAKSHEELENSTRREIEANRKRAEKQELVNSVLQKNLDVKYKELEEAISQNSINTTKSLSKLNEQIKQLDVDLENYKKVNNEAMKEQLKSVMMSLKKSEDRVHEAEGELKDFALKISALENDSLNFVRQEEEKLKFARVEDKLLRLPYIEEKAASIARLEERLNIHADSLQKAAEDICCIANTERSLIERLDLLEARPIPEIMRCDFDDLKDELMRKVEQLKLQMQGNLNTSLMYIQKFTDQRALDKLQKIRSGESSYTAKLNCLEWLLRYHEYLTGKAALTIIEAFRQNIYSSRIYERTAYSSAKHSSNIMEQLVRCIRGIRTPHSAQEASQVLADAGTFMSVLEIALMNDQNVDAGLTLGLLPDLARCILLLLSAYDLKQCRGELKLSIRCLTYCFQSSKAIDALLALPSGISTAVSLIESSGDEEVAANCLKIVRTCLASEKHYGKVVQKVPSLFTMLVKMVAAGQESALLEEAAATLRQYTAKAYVLQTIDDPNLLEPLCSIAIKNPGSKYRSSIIEVLRNCCKLERLMAYIKKTGAFSQIPNVQP